MLILITVLLVMIPAFAILYPLLRGVGENEFLEDESSPQAELARRWEAALAGLKNAELELALGNLDEDDHQWLRRQYMTEAALALKGMRLEEEQEEEFMAQVEREVREVRLRALGEDIDNEPPTESYPGEEAADE